MNWRSLTISNFFDHRHINEAILTYLWKCLPRLSKRRHTNNIWKIEMKIGLDSLSIWKIKINYKVLYTLLEWATRKIYLHALAFPNGNLYAKINPLFIDNHFHRRHYHHHRGHRDESRNYYDIINSCGGNLGTTLTHTCEHI